MSTVNISFNDDLLRQIDKVAGENRVADQS